MFKKYYELYESFVLRTPTNSLNYISKLENLINSKNFDESIYFASRQYFFLKNQKKTKIKHISTEEKYAYRSILNPAPFGLFSGCNIGKFAQKTILRTKGEAKRTTLLDNSVLYEIISFIVNSDELSKNLKFYPNNTLYSDHLSTKYYSTDRNSKYYLNSFKKNDSLKRILSFSVIGRTKREFINFLNKSFDPDRSCKFIDQLITKGILLPNILLDLNPNNGFKTILHYLKKYYSSSSLYHDLNEIEKRIILIDNYEADDNLVHFTRIEDILKSYFSLTNVKSIFNVNSSKRFKSNTLDNKVKDEIMESLELISKFYYFFEDTFIKSIKKEFFFRYKSKRVKLQTLFDHNTGLDSLTKKNIDNEYIRPFISYDLNKKTTVILPPIYNHLKNLLNKKKYCKTLKLSQKDFCNFKSNYHFSHTFSLIVEIYLIENKRMYFFEFIGGSTSTNFISRFTNYDGKIKTTVDKIFKDEASCNKNLFEVKFVNNWKSINVLKNSVQRKKEILLSGKKEINNKNTLYLNDLYLTLLKDEFILSDKNGNRVKPMLSTADDYENSSNGIYKFLGKLQHQSTIKSCEFFDCINGNDKIHKPRVELENIILSKARWSISVNELLKFKTKRKGIEKFKEWISFLKVENFVSIKDKTPKIFNISDEKDITKLYNFLLKYKKLLLTEYLGKSSISIIDGSPFHNEYVFFLKQTRCQRKE